MNTLQCILTVVGAKCKVSFDISNSLILVHCNIIHSSYMRGTQAPVAYNFFPNAAPGQKILEVPHNAVTEGKFKDYWNEIQQSTELEITPYRLHKNADGTFVTPIRYYDARMCIG